MYIRIKRYLIRNHWCKRYIIVDDNGKVIDDAQHFGYKSERKAILSWNYKHPDCKIPIPLE